MKPLIPVVNRPIMTQRWFTERKLQRGSEGFWGEEDIHSGHVLTAILQGKTGCHASAPARLISGAIISFSQAGSASVCPHSTCTDPKHHRSPCRPRASSRTRTRRTCGHTTRHTRRNRSSLHGRACALKVRLHHTADYWLNIILIIKIMMKTIILRSLDSCPCGRGHAQRARDGAEDASLARPVHLHRLRAVFKSSPGIRHHMPRVDWRRAGRAILESAMASAGFAEGP